MELAPNALTQDAQGILSAISRQELVNLYVVSHIRSVQEQVDENAARSRDVHALATTQMEVLYRSIYQTVDEAARKAGGGILTAMQSAGVMVDDVHTGFCIPPDELRFHAEYIATGPNIAAFSGIGRRNGREVQRIPLHELVVGAVYGRITPATGGKYPWTVDLVFTQSGQEVTRVELPLSLSIAPPLAMKDTLTRIAECRDTHTRLTESIRDIPALERNALAELTRRSLEANGIKLEGV